MARKKTPAGAKKVVPNEQLRKARELRHLTQKELGEEIGVTNITVNRWERGRVIPVPYHCQKLCDFFHMDAETLGLIPWAEKR